MTSTHTQSVVILGGGPAGLTAADNLSRQGYRVTVLDRQALPEPAQANGRVDTLSEPFTALGCHQATEALLSSLPAKPQPPTWVEIPLEFCLPNHSLVRYPRARVPAPLHIWVSLLRFAGLPWSERWRLASWLERLWEGDAQLPADLEQRTAEEWLTSLGHSTQTCRIVWNPLAQWLTGNDLGRLSADAFVNSVRPLFLSSRSNSRILIAQDSLDACLVHPITERLTQAGATILRGTDAVTLRYERDHISGIQLREGSLLQADWYIAALPPQQLTPLLPERWLTRYAYFQQLAELVSLDRTVHHLQAAQPCPSPRLVLLGDTAFHSAFVTESKPGHTSFSLITADRQFAQAQLDETREALIPGLLKSLGLLQPDSRITATHSRTIPGAILSLTPGTKLHRPIQRSPIANLLVAGAWTDTGWPPNLESAIVSGNRCAEAITLR